MEIEKRQKNWDTWMVQANRFAKRENYLDAIGRMEHMLKDIHQASSTSTSEKDKTIIDNYRKRSKEQLNNFQKYFNLWNEKIRSRRMQAIHQASQETHKPLPLGPEEKI